MTFFELEQIMHSMGINSLAEIARSLETTPQAVSNWKSRNKVPYHVVAKIKANTQGVSGKIDLTKPEHKSPFHKNEENISLSSILLAIVSYIKIIVILPTITVFITLLYI